MCPSAIPGASGFGDTTRQLNTHNPQPCEIHYRWHPWYGRRLWVHGIRTGRAQPTARCCLEPTQCAASLEVPLWMLEVTSCSTMCEAEDPRVDCASLQALKALLLNSVLKDRHPIAGGADANPHESNPTCTTGVVSPSLTGDPLAQVAAGNPTASGDVAVEVASRTRANPASPRRGEGGRP